MLTLGLDLGPNSIGWALVRDSINPETSEESDSSELVALGVRVFPEGVDAFDTAKEISRNESRRVARGMRRQKIRRIRRKKYLAEALVALKLWTTDPQIQQSFLDSDVYALRAKALNEKLSLHEIGRILLHLNQRRGFQSNRKKDRDDKEVQGMLGEISELENLIQASGSRTLGEFLHKNSISFQHGAPELEQRIRSRHTRRDMLINEFDAIWEHQSTYYPDILNNANRYGVHGRKSFPSVNEPATQGSSPALSNLAAFGIYGMIFFQRHMYWPKSVVGLCEYEPKEKRCPRADRHAEQFRLYQEINNLKYIDANGTSEQRLDKAQRERLFQYLSTREKATFDQIRTCLKMLESTKFNLERGERSTMKGMTIDFLVAKRYGKAWYELEESAKDELVRRIRDNQHEDEKTIEWLKEQYGVASEVADSLIVLDFPPGYMSVSLKAIDKLLPFLKQGMIISTGELTESALHAVGYLRRDELKRRLFDKLPDLKRSTLHNCSLGDLPNPVVRRALTELRKVVNAIIREYGKPDAVHVEMTRSLTMGPKARSQYNSKTRQIEREHDKAKEAIKGAGLAVRREGIIRYLLWQQQAHNCVYCAQPLSQTQLFGGEVDIDHIIPYSKCLDDSQANKVVCHRQCNATKGQRTPYEWLAASEPERYEQVCQHAGSLMRGGLMPYSKYRRFLQKDAKQDDFINRQLSDTGYITRATVEYLKLLFEKDHAVLGLKGQLTAELRHQWGLDTILQELPDSPAWIEANQLRSGEKDRSDHRHHAIDAVVLALTNRSRLQKLSKLKKAGGVRVHGEILDLPWNNFRESISHAVRDILVSHRVERKVAGALHEETIYAPTETPNQFAVRKPLVNLTANEIPSIRDETIRNLVLKQLAEHGLEVGRGKSIDSGKLKVALSDMKMASGVPIKKVRVLKSDQTIRSIREPSQVAYVKPGSMHHLCIFQWDENGKSKQAPVFISMLEATNRLKKQKQELASLQAQWNQEKLKVEQIRTRKAEAMRQIAIRFPLIDRHPPSDHENIPSHARFVMSLSRRELVLMNIKGEKRLLVFKTAASTQGQIYFALHSDARRSKEQAEFVFRANTLRGQKVTIDTLGRLRWAND